MREKAIVITGGANGIGASIALACAREGATPIIVDRDESATLQLQRYLSSQGLASECVLADLTDIENSCHTIANFARRRGRIDGLVNNAGINDGVSLEHGSSEKFLASLLRNVVHYYAVTHTLLPFLKDSRGTIVNIASKVAVTGQGRTSGYAAAKGEVLQLTREWAAELVQYGIRVNSIVPAEVITGQYESWLGRFDSPEEKRREITSKIPLGGRMTQPSEIADVVLFLLSSQSNFTGKEIYVDGGYVHLDRALT